jgi:hypothetical protein
MRKPAVELSEGMMSAKGTELPASFLNTSRKYIHNEWRQWSSRDFASNPGFYALIREIFEG